MMDIRKPDEVAVMGDDLTKHVMDENYICQHLSTRPQGALSWFDKDIAFLSTPFKRLGISGWTKTSCSAGGVGTIKQIAHSTDGFYTIDVEIAAFQVDCNHGSSVSSARSFGPSRFIRLEVEPSATAAHNFCAVTTLTPGMRLNFQGPVLIDRDGAGFYEVHPTRLWI